MKKSLFVVSVLGLSLGLIPSLTAQQVKVDEVVPKAVVKESKLDPIVLEKSIKRGVDFLLKTQNKDGSWGNATKTKGLNIYAPIPGAHHAFRMGSTCLALTGMIESADKRKEVIEAINRADEWLLKALPRLRRADVSTTYNVWGHAYALHSLANLARTAKERGFGEDRIALYRKAAQGQFAMLVRYQDIDGGWGYYHDLATQRPTGGSMSFTTAAVLTGIYDAQQAFNLVFPEKRLKQAVKSIIRQRTADFSYVYAMGHALYPRQPINRPGGSLARSQACNCALRLFADKKITDKVLTTWLDRLIKRNGWLDIGRKRPIPHETHFAVSGYFYYFGHYYAAWNIHLLPKAEQQQWKGKLANVIIRNQEKNGCWWDYPLYNYHYAYGTGYALSTLSRCR